MREIACTTVVVVGCAAALLATLVGVATTYGMAVSVLRSIYP